LFFDDAECGFKFLIPSEFLLEVDFVNYFAVVIGNNC